MDMNIIGPLLVVDMKERLGAPMEEDLLEDIIEQVARCKTMSDINQLLCTHHVLFSDENDALYNSNPILSVYGTQDYIIGLLTKRIVNDKKIIHNWNLDEFPPADHDFGKYESEEFTTQTRLGDSTDWDRLSR